MDKYKSLFREEDESEIALVTIEDQTNSGDADFEGSMETETEEVDGPYKDQSNRGEDFGDKPASDENWSESKKVYKRIFEDDAVDTNTTSEQGESFDKDVELKTGDWESSTDNDFADGGEVFGDKPVSDDNWNGDSKEDGNEEFDVDDSFKDISNGGETYGDKPASDTNWSESVKSDRYKRIFESECDCANCDNPDCDNAEMKECSMICEDCPYGKAGGGMCANADNTAKLKGRCQPGWIWDKVNDKCVPTTNK